jgi:hypothetical protein
MTIKIVDGVLTCVYHDKLHQTLQRLGNVTITRASRVEYDHESGGWVVDLSPTKPGVVFGPFVSRADALLSEQAWLDAELRN